MNEHDARIKAMIVAGDVDALRAEIASHPELVRARLATTRTLLHVATDWPGHFPNVAAMIRMLVEAGVDVNARVISDKHRETALHWAASSDDVDALEALLDCGADIEADGAVIGGGTAMSDACAFGQWRCARRLLERGARANLWQAAALGLVDRVRALVENASAHDVTNAFWSACHGGQRATAELLLAKGADRDWLGHDALTPLGAATRGKHDDVATWLRSIGAR